MTEQLHLPFKSVPEMFLNRVASTPAANAFSYPGPNGPEWLTWRVVGERATAIAAGLNALGVKPEDTVAIAAATRIDWVLADLGVMCAGAATTTIYPTTEPKDAQFILADSGARVLIAEDAAQAAKTVGASLPALTHIVVMDGTFESTLPVLTLAQLEEKGRALLASDPDLITRIAAGVKPEHLATLMYTSGTTGTPKGVELLHRGWVWQGVAQTNIGMLRPGDLQYLWLPLSHSFGKTLLCGIIASGCPTYVDGRIDKIAALLPEVKPTIMCGAPRIFEKIYNGVHNLMKAEGGAKLKIFRWAVRTGRKAYERELAGKRVGAGLAFKRGLADKLVFSKIRARVGGRMRAMVSGSAPLNKDIAEFFHVAGMTIYEGYGLTETSAGNCVNVPEKFRFGTVGLPIADLQVRLDTDGEVLLKGPSVMRGYHNLPEETARVFTEDGWFRTGDIGEIDSQGFLKITDRKKDLIKTSGGKYIAPSHLEGQFKAICPYVSQVVIIGQARNFVTMLLTIDPDAATKLADADGPFKGRSYAQIAASDEMHAMIEESVKELNSKLNRWETVKKFTILPRDLAIDTGELTPSLKVKRKGVETNFSAEIEKLYEGTLAEV